MTIGLPHLLVAFAVLAPSTVTGTDVFVSPTGSDTTGDGSITHPFLSVSHAVQSGKVVGGTSVQLRAGTYHSTDGTALLLNWTGRSETVSFAAYRGEEVLWSAGQEIQPSAVTPVTNASVLARLPTAAARTNVRRVSLKQLGITDYGAVGASDEDMLELFYAGEPMHLARYPNVNSTDPRLWQWEKAVSGRNSTFVYSGNRPTTNNWAGAHDAWIHMYSFFDWSDDIMAIAGLNPANSSITLHGDPLYGWAKGARWLAFNLLEELDEAKEYFVDRSEGVLYFWPPVPSNADSSQKMFVSMQSKAVDLSGSSHVTVTGIEIAHARDVAVIASGVLDVHIVGCSIGNSGSNALRLSGLNSSVEDCVFSGTGHNAAAIGGGDPTKLLPGNVTATGNTIHSYSRYKRTYQPGIAFSGVANVYSHNTIYDAPHQAFLGSCNDCLFEYNNVSHMGYETADAGAWYAGRNWDRRGNTLRYNHFEDILQREVMQQKASTSAIYFDDQLSGNVVYGNTFVDVNLGILLGGGRHHQVYNNTFVRCDSAVALDDRGLTWQKQYCGAGGIFQGELEQLNYTVPPWSTHYPVLVNVMKDHPCVPVYNNVSFNNYCDCGTFADVTAAQASAWLSTLAGNTETTTCASPTGRSRQPAADAVLVGTHAMDRGLSR